MQIENNQPVSNDYTNSYSNNSNINNGQNKPLQQISTVTEGLKNLSINNSESGKPDTKKNKTTSSSSNSHTNLPSIDAFSQHALIGNYFKTKPIFSGNTAQKPILINNKIGKEESDPSMNSFEHSQSPAPTKTNQKKSSFNTPLPKKKPNKNQQFEASINIGGSIITSGGDTLIGNNFGGYTNLSHSGSDNSYSSFTTITGPVNVNTTTNNSTRSFQSQTSISGNITSMGGHTLIGNSFGNNTDFSYTNFSYNHKKRNNKKN